MTTYGLKTGRPGTTTAEDLAGKVSHSLATAENDVLVGAPTPFGSWVKKTLAEFKTILGLGTAAYTAATAYDAAGTAAGKIAASISDGDTTHAPDGNSVFDALALKAPLISPSFTTPALGTPASGALSNCTLLTPPTIGETTPNSIRGTNKEVYRTASAGGALTVAECSGTIISFLGLTDAACDIPLPTAVEGLAFVWILPTERAQIVRLRAATNDQIYLLGVHGTDNGYIGYASGWVHGTCCSMFTFKNTDGGWDWMCIPIFGTVVAS